jgi:hypothetical protein
MYRAAVRLFVTMLMALATLAFNAAPTPAQQEFTAGITFDQTTFDPKTGAATITGRLTCSEPTMLDVFAELRQLVGRVATIRGAFSLFVECPGPEGIDYRVTVQPDTGKFSGGRARLSGFLNACRFDPEIGGCVSFFTEEINTILRLKGGK